jgi:hypothetical protein
MSVVSFFSSVTRGAFLGSDIKTALGKQGVVFASGWGRGALYGALSGAVGEVICLGLEVAREYSATPPWIKSAMRVTNGVVALFGSVLPLAMTLSVYHASWRVFKTCIWVNTTSLLQDFLIVISLAICFQLFQACLYQNIVTRESRRRFS